MKKSALLLCLILAATLAIAESAPVLPTGTPVKIRLQNTLATYMSKPGDPFYGRIVQPVSDFETGRIMIPAGSTVQGHVTVVKEPRRISGKPTIGLHPDTVTLPTGEKLPFSAVLVDTNLRHGTDVNEEGQFKGDGRDRRDNIETAVGGGSGVLIGALAGGLKGGLIGAGIGVTATTVYWLVQHRSGALPAGTELQMELSRPLAVTLNPAVAATGAE
jgi:hypothetical protein